MGQRVAPIIIQDSAVPAAASVRTFVSYSHEDAALAATFDKYLGLLWEELRFDRNDLFFDARRLLPGYVWQDVLMSSLSSSRLCVFLISADSLRSDHYCMQAELPASVAAGARIVPVILTQCPWEGLRIPGHPDGRTFGDLTAVPVTEKRKVRPVTHWGKPDQAWDLVISSLRQTLREFVPGPRMTAVAEPAASTRPVPSDLLPYLCDQTAAVGGFDRGLAAWRDRALVVLIKGIYDDNTPRFWERLRVEPLAQFLRLTPTHGAAASPHRPFVLPTPESRTSSAELRRMILYELSEALTDNRYQITNAAALAHHLKSRNGVVPLFAMPNAGSGAMLRRAVEALLGVIDQVSDPEAAGRLVIAVNFEGSDLLARNLTQEWKLRRFKRSAVVELDPLSDINHVDAGIWHEQRQIKETYGLEEHKVAALFEGGARLRMRTFGRLVQPLFAAR
jgi:hypothetical protein